MLDWEQVGSAVMIHLRAESNLSYVQDNFIKVQGDGEPNLKAWGKWGYGMIIYPAEPANDAINLIGNRQDRRFYVMIRGMHKQGGVQRRRFMGAGEKGIHEFAEDVERSLTHTTLSGTVDTKPDSEILELTFPADPEEKTVANFLMRCEFRKKE